MDVFRGGAPCNDPLPPPIRNQRIVLDMTTKIEELVFKVCPPPVRIPGRMPGACVLLCCMLRFLYFPVTCNPPRAVTLPDIEVAHYIGVLHRLTYPYPPHRAFLERRWHI